MSLVDRLDPGPRGAWLVLAAIVAISVVVLAAALLCRATLRRHAATRHGVWLGALACTLLAPAVVLLAEFAGLTLPILPPARVAAEGGPPIGPVAFVGPGMLDMSESIESTRPPLLHRPHPAVAVAPGPPAPPPTERPAAGPDPRMTTATTVPVAGPTGRARSAAPGPVLDAGKRGERGLVGTLTIVWAAGVAIGLGRLALGWRRLVALRRSLRPFAPGEHAAVLVEVRAALAIAELPTIATSRSVAGPVAIGLWSPVVVLPESLAGSLTAGQLRDVLVHECAHVRRRDLLVGVFQRVAAVLYWPHPLVHYLNDQIARAREEVCDNFVIRSGDPCEYARTLLDLTERCWPGRAARAGVGLIDARWTLRDRIAGLLDPRRDAMTEPNRRAAGLAALALVATCLGIAGLRPAAPTAAGPQDADKGAAPTAQPPERVVRGLVVDEAGQPVAGATVRPTRADKAAEPAKTESDGRFTLTINGFMLLEEDLVASTEGDALMGFGEHVEPQSSAPAEPVRIVVRPNRAVAVRVRDAAGGPVAGAAVEAVGFDWQGAATTGDDGLATLRVPADAQVRWIIGLKPGVGFDYFENYRDRSAVELDPPPTEVALTLDGARTVRIKAVDTAGRPVPGVEFRSWHVDKPGKLDHANIGGAESVRAITDERGIATFDWLPAVVVEAVPFLTDPGAYSCPVSPELRPGSGPVELEARLLRATPIRGFVRDADGRPAAGILLRAEGRGATNHYCRMHTRTAPDGSYAFAVDPDQSYMIAAIDDRRAARSLTGIVVREGQPRSGLDLTLGEGTLLRGRVTNEPDGTPAADQTITLVQSGEPLPAEFVSNRGEGPTESLPRWAKPDAEGRYQIRVGPGRYELWGPDHGKKEELRIEAEPEVLRDFAVVASSRTRPLAGLAIEVAPAGDRPIAGAIVEASPVGGNWYRKRAFADDAGRFRLAVEGDKDLVVYIHDRDGTLAGFTVVAADAVEVRATATPAARLRGRVVDARGRPRADWRVQLQLASGPNYQESGHFVTHMATDADGRYDFGGVPVGAEADVSVSHHDDRSLGGGAEVQRFVVRAPGPLDLPDLVVSAAPIEAAPAAVPPRAAPDAALPATIPVAPTRAEVEALVRAIGRDPASPDLVDRAWLKTRPQFAWAVDLDRIGALVADPDFTQRVDEASRAVHGHPADTLSLIRRAIAHRIGGDLESEKWWLGQRPKDAAPPVSKVAGTVVDAATGRPIAGAIVYSNDALARTDDVGAFRLQPLRPQRQGMIWAESDGYAMAEYPALAGAADPADVRIELVADSPVVGLVVGADDAPIVGATVRAWVKHYDFRRPRPDPAPANDSYGFPIEVRTDPDGRFAIRGLPPSLSLSWYEVRHPEHQTLRGLRSSPLKAGDPTTLRLEPGSLVAGIVVDEQGQPLPGAMIDIRQPGRLHDEFRAYTAADGRFRFGGVTPGRWMVVVQPERHASVTATVVATRDRPVENQYVAGPSLFIGGRVVGPDGDPVAGVAVGWVQPIDERGHPAEGLELGLMTGTAADGTFRLGPLPPGEFSLTGVIEEPRRLGRARTRSNQTDAVIRLEPDPRE